MASSIVDIKLQQLEKFGVCLGLETSRRLLAQLGNPEQRVPIVHVAGSNGKGSVCAYLSSVLAAAGYRVGRYTSPHLIDWSERICINGQPIAQSDLEQTLDQVLAAIQPPEIAPTQFEVITAVAWLYFAQQRVDLAIVEVGLGGRLDATNVCDRPLVSIITSLSMEHWQRLGPTLADIAREKAGILKPGCPAVIGQIPPEAAAVVQARLTELACPAVYPQPARDLGQGWAEFSSDSQTIQYPLALQGAIQRHNSVLAIAALVLLRQQGWQIPDAAIVAGMAQTEWAGRLQWFPWQTGKILIDGAHNPASAEVLRQFIDSLPTIPPVHWVMGMLSTKDHREVFQALLRSDDSLYLTVVPDHSSANPVELAQLARAVCPELTTCQVYADVFTALAAATATPPATAGEYLTVLCGSLYLIGDFFRQVKQGGRF